MSLWSMIEEWTQPKLAMSPNIFLFNGSHNVIINWPFIYGSPSFDFHL